MIVTTNILKPLAVGLVPLTRNLWKVWFFSRSSRKVANVYVSQNHTLYSLLSNWIVIPPLTYSWKTMNYTFSNDFTCTGMKMCWSVKTNAKGVTNNDKLGNCYDSLGIQFYCFRLWIWQLWQRPLFKYTCLRMLCTWEDVLRLLCWC